MGPPTVARCAKKTKFHWPLSCGSKDSDSYFGGTNLSEMAKMSALPTDELKRLLKVLPEVLLVAVCGGEALVLQQALLVVVEGQVRGDVQHETDVQPLHELQILSIVFIPQVQEGEDGGQLGVLHVGRSGQGGGQGSGPTRIQPLIQLQEVLTKVLMTLPEAAQASYKRRVRGFPSGVGLVFWGPKESLQRPLPS